MPLSAQILDVVLGVVVDEPRVGCAQRVRGTLPGRLVLAHGDAENEVTLAEMLGIPARVVGVVAQHALQPALDGARQSVPLALDVDPADVAVPLQHLVAIGSETRVRQALADTAQRRVVEEHSDDGPARIGESVASVGHVRDATATLALRNCRIPTAWRAEPGTCRA